MNCSLSWLHGTSCHHLPSPCAKQPAPGARNRCAVERRFQFLRTDCAADVAAPIVCPADTISDHAAWSSSSRLSSAEQAVVQAPESPSARPDTSSAIAPAVVQHHDGQTNPCSEQPSRVAIGQQSMMQIASPQVRSAVQAQPQQQQRKHKQRGRRRNGSTAATSSGTAPTTLSPSAVTGTGRKAKKQRYQQPVEVPPCERGGSIMVADTVCKLLRRGQQVALAAGSGMQLPRGVAALATARSLMLSSNSSTGLVFQPCFSIQQSHSVQHSAVPVEADHEAASPAASEQALQGSQPCNDSSSTRQSLVFTACRVAEAQLRRHEQDPLVAARYGSASKLAAATFARICQQGYTAIRASGPDAVRLALLAAAEARQKLVCAHLDIALVPVTEFVDVDSLQDLQDQQAVEYEQFDYSAGSVSGSDDADDRQFVRVTVLHVMRCQLKQPWKLLPQRVPFEQLPATLWEERQQKKQLSQPVQGGRESVQQLQVVHKQQQQQAAAVLQQAHVAEQLVQQQLPVEQPLQVMGELVQPWQHMQVEQPADVWLNQVVDCPHPCQQPHAEVHSSMRQEAAGAAAAAGTNKLEDGRLETSGGSAVPLPASAVAATASTSTYSPLRGVEEVTSSGSSMDGSLWCQADDAAFAAVYVGEGLSCSDEDVDVLQLAPSASHTCSNSHPGQALLLQKQRQGKSSKRQLVAAAQGQGSSGSSSGTSSS